MRENYIFWHIMLYFIKWNARKDLCSVWRRCCDWLNISEVVCSFMLEIPHWMRPSTVRTFHSQVDELKLIVIKWRYWEQSMLYHTRDSRTYSKYPNQTLKIICGYVHSFDVWVPHKLCKKKKKKHQNNPSWWYFQMWFSK